MKPASRSLSVRVATGHIALVAALLALHAGCQAIPADNDPYVTRDRTDPGLPVLEFQWKVAVSERMHERKPQEFASPALYGRTLFIGSSQGQFYALSTRDGRVRWQTRVGAISSQPVVDVLKGRIYVGTDDGSMVCMRAVDGSELWRYSTRGPILQPPVVADGLVLFSNEDDHVYALEADTGKFRWQYKAETPDEYTLRGHAGVAVDDGIAFTGFANGSMVALRQGTGKPAWLASIKGDSERFVDVDGTPVIAGDQVYITSSSGGVYALDKTTGLIRWRHPMEGAGGIAIEGERLYVAAANDGIHALDRDGHVIWRQGTYRGGEPALPVISGSYLVYELSDDGVFIADKHTGRVYQYFNPGDGISSTPAFEPAGDRMYILSNRGILYALDVHRF